MRTHRCRDGATPAGVLDATGTSLPEIGPRGSLTGSVDTATAGPIPPVAP